MNVRRQVAALLALTALALGACGASGASGAQTDDDRYREIQRHEATVARSRALVVDGEPGCAAGCDAAARATEAAEGICALGAELGEQDAQTRCRSGRAAAVELDARLRPRCECGRAAGVGVGAP